MSTYNFTPSSDNVFSVNITLDGQPFILTTTWNYFGARWYINIFTANQELVYTMPLIGSVGLYNISLLPQLNPLTGLPWVSTLIFNSNTQQFVVSP